MDLFAKSFQGMIFVPGIEFFATSKLIGNSF